MMVLVPLTLVQGEDEEELPALLPVDSFARMERDRRGRTVLWVGDGEVVVVRESAEVILRRAAEERSFCPPQERRAAKPS